MGESREEVAGVIAPPPILYAGALVLGLVLQAIRPVGILSGPAVRALGLMLVAVGGALGRAGFVALRRAGTEVNPDKPVTALVVTGPYRFTRNPLYLSLTLIYSGLTLLANALWPAVLLPVLLVVVRRGVIDREERYLERRFGQEYRDYKGRVRRWI